MPVGYFQKLKSYCKSWSHPTQHTEKRNSHVLPHSPLSRWTFSSALKEEHADTNTPLVIAQTNLRVQRSRRTSSLLWGSLSCLPSLTACISCTSSWSARLAFRKTLLPPWLISAAKKGHLLPVPWLEAREGCPDGSCVPSVVCWDPSGACCDLSGTCCTSALAVLSSEGGNGKTEASDLAAQDRGPLVSWVGLFSVNLPLIHSVYFMRGHTLEGNWKWSYNFFSAIIF